MASRPIEEAFPYVYLDGVVLKRSWGGEVRNVSDKAGWLSFLKHLKDRGLGGIELIISPRRESSTPSRCLLGARRSSGRRVSGRCLATLPVHFYRNVFSVVPRQKVREVARMLKAIHASEDRPAARSTAVRVRDKLVEMKLKGAAKKVEASIEETLTYYQFPEPHWLRIRTNNPMEPLIREIRRRSRVVGAFPDGQSALMLCAARLRYVASSK